MDKKSVVSIIMGSDSDLPVMNEAAKVLSEYNIPFETKILSAHRFSVVRALVGHGIGTKIHEEPEIPNFGRPGMGPILEPGMVLAIEPMVNAGTFEVETLDDGWSIVTKDRKLSAHFEHTIAITASGPKILTK